ncbi:GTPase-activating protein [Babesia caballi]|uniref:GTPase-activating protein n=1 Tax=Babesia caballi TaxID=5871 RepID=A0AAV4M010_BABCB|nr:GTPase-activating protein [Babesia caballi]
MYGNAVAGRICSIEGNNICADCGCRSPRWASVNLGVLLCINCSGVHRTLGVHLSQVKSLTLDNLKPEWIKVLSEVGNDLANKYYLHKLPAHAPRPNANTSAKDMEIWIRNKYERKVYAMDGIEEPYILLGKGYNPRDVILKGGLGQVPQPQPAGQAVQSSFGQEFGKQGEQFNQFDSSKATAGVDDLFGGAAANNPSFAAFQDGAPQTTWTGDFWPTASGSGAGQPASYGNLNTAGSNSSTDARKLVETKVEAAKDSISKLFENPAQIGFKNSSYPQSTPSCVQGDLLDFQFGSLGDKLQAQKKQQDDLI